jgi:RNA polymerase sigma-70 factor (ECF subfamily)
MKVSKQEEFLALYEPIHDRFERFCRARVYGDMDFRDLINETLLVAFDKFDTLRSKDAFLSFLFSISIRILSNKNAKKKEQLIADDNQVERIHGTDISGEVNTDIHFLFEALSELNSNQRECIILFEISGFSIKEIAQIQDSNESSVKQRLRRGRLKLSEILNYEAVPKTGKNYE